MGLVTPTRAIVRRPSQCYASCLRHDPRTIDVALAQQQHAGYVQALRDAGIELDELPELDEPDACFVEDTAVVLGDRAIVTRPGAPSRRGEIGSIAAALEQHVTVVRMTAPATLDGGDVLRCAGALVVGLSSRTNREGLAQLAAIAGVLGLAVVGIEVRAGLHLKSACTLAGAHTLLVQPGVLELDALRELELEPIEVPEPEGANVLAFADRVLCSSAAPRTAELLARRGLSPRSLDLSEIHAGDGALSCLSLRFAPTGDWAV